MDIVTANPFLLIFLAAFVPTAFFSALNQKYFTAKQLRNALSIAFGASVLFGLAASWLHSLLAASSLAEQAASVGINAPNALIGLLGLLLYALLGERFFSDLQVSPSARRGILGVSAAALFVISALYSIGPFTIILLLMLVSAGVDGFRQRKTERHILIRDDATSTSDRKAVLDNGIRLEKKPNIYVLLLESYHSSAAVRHLYGIDDSETISALRQLDYTIYENTYSNASSTLPSLATLISGSLGASTGSGKSFALDVLRTNGYACSFFSWSPYVFSDLAQHGDYVSLSLPPSATRLYSLAGPLFSQSKYLRRLVGGIDIFPEIINFESIFTAFRRETLRKRQQPQFSMIHFGAVHLSEWVTVPDFIEDYKTSFVKAQAQLRLVTEFLAEHDPEALVIAIGDHGGMQHLLTSREGPHLQESLRSMGVSNETFAFDMFSVLLAIRSPVPQILGVGPISHVNVFRRVFAGLGGGKHLLASQAPNISHVSGNICVQDGQVLDPFIRGSAAAVSMHAIAQRRKAGEATPSELLQLAEIETGRNPDLALQLLREALEKQPHQAAILHKMGEVYLLTNDAKSCACLKKAWKLAPDDTHIAAAYYRSLLLHGQPGVAEEFFESEKLISNPEAVRLGVSALRMKNFESESLMLAHRASAASPGNMLFRYILAWAYYDLHLYKKAKSELRVILDEPSENTAPEVRMAKIQERSKFLLHFSNYHLGETAEIEAYCNEMGNTRGHGWRFILLSAAFEKQGRISDAFCCLLNAVPSSALNEIVMRIAFLASRYGISEPSINPLVEDAHSVLDHRVRAIEASNVFDAKWYAAKYMRSGEQEKPIVHYMTHGLYHDLNPTPWFGTARYMINDYWPWWSAKNPFWAFLSQGVTPGNMPFLLLDPMVAMCAYNRQPTANPDWMKALVTYHETPAPGLRQAV